MNRAHAPCSLLLASIASLTLLSMGCGGGDNTPPPNPGEPSASGGSAGAGGSSGGAGASGSSGSAGSGVGGSSGGSGTGGSSGSAGGAAGAGASGSSGSAGSGQAGGAGASGSSGSSGSAGASGQAGFEDVAGCTFDKAQDLSSADAEVKQVGTSYDPACIRIKVGQSVSFKGDFTSHPLSGMKNHGTQPNPIGEYSSAPVNVTFDAPGSYGYYCTIHGNDGPPGQTSMSGAVYVVP